MLRPPARLHSPARPSRQNPAPSAYTHTAACFGPQCAQVGQRNEHLEQQLSCKADQLSSLRSQFAQSMALLRCYQRRVLTLAPPGANAAASKFALASLPAELVTEAPELTVVSEVTAAVERLWALLLVLSMSMDAD